MTEDNLPENIKPKEVEIWQKGKAPVSLLVCKRCYIGKGCPMYEVDSIECGIEKLEHELDATTTEGIVGFIQSMLALQARRVRRLAAFEDLEGGLPDPRVTEEIHAFMMILEKLKKLLSDEDSLVIRAKGKAASNLIAKFLDDDS
jgi:hypothetical protein